MSKRYIDVDKFAEKICSFQQIDEDAANAMIWLLRTFPTADVVEVVRCKDCKYWKEHSVDNLDDYDSLKEFLRDAPIQSLGVGQCCCEHWNTLKKPIITRKILHIERHETCENDFCSYGERREG